MCYWSIVKWWFVLWLGDWEFCLYMKVIDGYWLIMFGELVWCFLSKMCILNVDYLECMGSELFGVWFWWLLLRSVNILYKYVFVEEFYFVFEGIGWIWVGEEMLMVLCYGGVLVGLFVLC